MAIAFDNTGAAVTSGTGNLSWSHVGAASNVKGVIVQIVQDSSQSNDQITSVTYGSLGLTRVTGATQSKATGEVGAVYTYVGTSGIPQGTQTVTVTVTASGGQKDANSYSYTGAANTQVEGSAVLSSDSTANPSVTITCRTGVSAGAVGLLLSGQNATGGVAITNTGSAYTQVEETDLGNQVASFERLTTVSGGGNIGMGWTATAEDAIIGAVALSELQAFSITANTTSYSVGGLAASTVAGRQVTASPASYSEGGIAASVVAGRMTTASPGSLGKSGLAAGVVAGRVAGTEIGSNALSGASATLEKAAVERFIASDPGTYNESGVQASILAGRSLSLDAGAATVSGATAWVVAGRIVSLSPGSFSKSGNQTALNVDRQLLLSPGTYSNVGFVSGDIADRVIDLGVYSMTYTGSPAQFAVIEPVSIMALAGNYAIDGQGVPFVSSALVNPGAMSLSGRMQIRL